jgi:hypothetical protein
MPLRGAKCCGMQSFGTIGGMMAMQRRGGWPAIGMTSEMATADMPKRSLAFTFPDVSGRSDQEAVAVFNPEADCDCGACRSGKSALVAKTARQCRALARCRKGLCIEHYVGATPSSASLLGTLRRLNAELGLIPANQVEQLAADVHDFSESFARAFQKLPADRTCYLIIDALDQMEAEHSAHDLHWLPAVLPDHVQLVLSLATDGQDVSSRRLLAALRLRDAAWIDLADHPLTDADRRSLIERIPSMASKSLEPEHIASLLDNPGTRNPCT